MSVTISVLDGYTSNPGDLSWDPIQQLGSVQIYDRTSTEQLVERAKEADILLINKIVLDADTLDALPKLKCICLLATGYDNVDIQAAAERNIPVCNVVGYSTEAVTQQVFALIFELTNQVGKHNESVQAGDWQNSTDFSYTLRPIPEVYGKTLGIYGFGRIGQRVADVALAFGMQVIAHHKHPERDARPGVRLVSLPELFSKSDILRLHAPLSEANAGIVDIDLLKHMKSSALLINTGRGGLINEPDLRDALQEDMLAGAGLDVLSSEPPPPDHPLIGLSNCIITPHHAWASQEARERLIREVAQNVQAFLDGKPRNVVNR